jgi:ATP-binding cassette subfamily B protein
VSGHVAVGGPLVERGGDDADPPDVVPEATQDDYVDLVELAKAGRARRRTLSSTITSIKQSLALVWRADHRLAIITSVLQFIGGIIAAVQVLVIKYVLNAIVATADHKAPASGAIPSVVALALTTSFATVSAAVLGQQQRLLSELVSRRTWQSVLDVASAVPLRSFESSGFFDRLNRVQTNATVRPYMLSQGVIGLIGGIAGSVGLAIAIASLQPLLLPLLLLSGVPLWITGRLQSRREFAFAISQSPRLRRRNYLLTVLTDRNSAKELRAFGFGPRLRRQFDLTYGEFVADLRAHVARRSWLAFVGSLISAAILAGTLGVLVWLVGRGSLSLAAAGAAIVAVRLMASQVTTLFSSVQQIQESALFLDDFADYMKLAPASAESEGGAPAPTSFSKIGVNNLTFTYPGSRRPALRDVSLELRAGEIVAIVGENGSGKTTLAKMLAALYEPDQGSITWDDVDLRSYDRAGLRKSISVIFQDFVRYELTARENIAASMPDVEESVATLTAAAVKSGAADFLLGLPDGYETILSKAYKGGRDLSLGQWQRVALARAFYRDAPFVILDEPSASLDPRAEHELFSRIRYLLRDRTVLFISHRFSTVRSADRIFVMADGQIIERGAHDELIATKGLYAELFGMQAEAYQEKLYEGKHGPSRAWF